MIIDAVSGLGEGRAAIEAAASFSLQATHTVTVVGDAEDITSALNVLPCDAERIRVVHAHDDRPAAQAALARAMGETSGDPDAVVISGAGIRVVQSVARSELEPVDTIDSTVAFEPFPVLRPVESERRGFAILGDVGAHRHATENDIRMFAVFGAAYARTLLDVEEPTVALVSPSRELINMPRLQQASYRAIEHGGVGWSFGGFALPNRVFDTDTDVIVTDGYGGAILNAMIDAGLAAGGELLERSRTGLRNRLGLRAFGETIRRVRTALDADTYGGSVLLGYSAPVIAVRPDAGAEAWTNALKLATECRERGLAEAVREACEAERRSQ